jgi:hypothetical protein
MKASIQLGETASREQGGRESGGRGREADGGRVANSVKEGHAEGEQAAKWLHRMGRVEGWGTPERACNE